MNEYRSFESQEDRVIRITTETLMVHCASRAERGHDSPLTEQDMARLRLLAELRTGTYGATVKYLIQQAFNPDNEIRPETPPTPEGEA